MTLSSLAGDVRALARDDATASVHYDDATVCAALKDAVTRLRTRNPATRYANGVLADIAWPSATADLLAFDPGVDDRYRLGLCYFAAGRLLERDSVDTVNAQLAAAFLQKADVEFAP